MWEEDEDSAEQSGHGRWTTFPSVLSFTNPMHNPIQVQFNFLCAPLPAATTTAPTDESGAAPQRGKRSPPFTITLPTFTSGVAAFAEAWEYDDEDEDDMRARGFG